MKEYIKTLIFALLTIQFWLGETHWFGGNLTAQSNDELICDGIVLVMFMITVMSIPKFKEESK